MRGFSFRRLPEWIARAMSSLPVPVSPVMRTPVSVSATLRTLSKDGGQGRALPDDLLKVVNGFDFFLQVQVLLLEPGLLLLHKHAFRDVHDHGARVLPVRLRLGPPLHPDWAAVVLAAKFQDDSAGVRPPAHGGQGLAGAPLGVGRVRH
jgi:hypothetical protein